MLPANVSERFPSIGPKPIDFPAIVCFRPYSYTSQGITKLRLFMRSVRGTRISPSRDMLSEGFNAGGNCCHAPNLVKWLEGKQGIISK